MTGPSQREAPMPATRLPAVHLRVRSAALEAPQAGPLAHAAAAVPALGESAAAVPSLPASAGIVAVLESVGLPARAFDPGTIAHSERVATYAAEIASALGLSRAEIGRVRLGAYLHDVGKLKVSPRILRKPGRLTDAEFAIMKMHPIWGLELLEGAHLRVDVRPTVRWHHEKCDGSGYPDGLTGDEIPLHASIVGIADVYDALTSSRSYRPPMSSSGAMALMRVRRDSWRAEVYAAFCRAAASTTLGAALLVAAAAATRRREVALGSSAA